MYVISLISRYIEHPSHLLAAKRKNHYLQGAADYELFYKNGENSGLMRFYRVFMLEIKMAGKALQGILLR